MGDRMVTSLATGREAITASVIGVVHSLSQPESGHIQSHPRAESHTTLPSRTPIIYDQSSSLTCINRLSPTRSRWTRAWHYNNAEGLRPEQWEGEGGRGGAPLVERNYGFLVFPAGLSGCIWNVFAKVESSVCLRRRLTGCV